MVIDDRIEPLVRDAIETVVRRNPKGLRRALAAFPDDDTTTRGVQLAAAIGLGVLHDVYGRRPTGAEICAVAAKLADMERWVDVTPDEVTAFLNAALDGRPATDVLSLERVVLLAYVIAGNLLASCCKDSEWWFDYLDRVEAAIEAETDLRR